MGHISPTDLVLWAESPEEARVFLDRAANAGSALFPDKIFVGKRGPTFRSNGYVGGFYHETSDDRAVTLYTDVIEAPPKIVELVQWCTCDIMLSRGCEPIFVLEDTTHIVRMNVYQRAPRLFKAAILGVPAIVLQGTRGLDFSLRGDCWGFHRYMRAFGAISAIYPDTGVLPFYYIANDNTRSEAIVEKKAFDYMESLVRGDVGFAAQVRQEIRNEVDDIVSNGFRGHFAPPIQSINVGPSSVTVRIGANADKKSWREKGSGQMDPYIGMIAAAKYIYCFDASGVKNKEMVVEFTNLPPGFWWFKDWQNSASLYKTLAFQIADRVEFLGT